MIGRPILAHTAGHTCLDVDSPIVTPRSVFALASCTKLLTAIAALRYVERGMLALDDATAIEKHIPELCAQGILCPDFSSNDSTKSPQVVDRKKPITLHALLTHTSGSAYDILAPPLIAWRASRGEVPQALSGAPLPGALATPLLFEPGTAWSYGGGLDWVGLLLERIARKSLGEVLQEEVFDVVGFSDYADFEVPPSAGKGHGNGALVQCVKRNEETGALSAFPMVVQQSQRGGGGLYGSAEDFCKVLQDVVGAESRLLGREAVSVLFGAQLAGNADAGALASLRGQAHVFRSMMGALLPQASADGEDSLSLGINHSIGGLLVDGAELGGKKRGPVMTWGGAFNCLWFASREEEIAGFYASSQFPPGEAKSAELMGEFVREVWAGHERLLS